MSGRPDSQPDLTSWKEIAEYLGVTVRTAQNWERERALPVKRLPGKRSMVCASPAELDAWRSAQVTPEQQPARRWSAGLIGLGALVLLGLAIAGYHFVTTQGGVPAGFRVEQDTLIVLDGHGQPLWRRTFPAALTQEEYLESGAKPGQHRFWVGDLDGDNIPEVLFVQQSALINDPGLLICYSIRGRELWRKKVGRPVHSKRSTPTDIFRIRDFAVMPGGKTDGPRIVVSSSQSRQPDYPDQVLVLERDGKTRSEYWHSGWLDFVAVADRDIFLGGISNGNHAATLVVLDIDNVSGVSAEPDPDFQILDMPPAHEKARLFFPRTCINQADDYNYFASMMVDGDTITAEIAEQRPVTRAVIWYRLGLDLELQSAVPHDTFLSLHAEMYANHLLNHEFSAEERAKLKDVRIVRAQ